MRDVVIAQQNSIDIPCSISPEPTQQSPQELIGNALNNVWTTHKDKFKEWLLHKRISDYTKRDYLSALTKFFENHLVYKPMEFRNKQLKDKEERGLRNLFLYFEDGEIDNICGYSLEKWRRYVKIKKSGVVEIYVTDSEIKEAYEACPDNLKPIYRLLVYSGNRFTHIYEMLQKFDELNIITDGEVAHYPTSSLSKGTKQTFHMFFPSSYIPELKKIGNLDSYDHILKNIQSGRVSAKTIRKWHLNKMIKEGITESLADFIQGRASLTVGSAHYLNKTGQAKDQYCRIIGKFPI
ncbi:integrase [Methanosarcina mazei TMA]|uniref:integrase n=1 Tax=Methanosarcina mazei TaxID=2209 RepID=UPI001C342BAA|nr:integrase [Methanosarcina mazei]UWJ23234.1 integrase [Methanosarcina mazei TMA]BBL65718.1 integrase [Methanosarcina mazei]